jgi:alkylated DNA repair protein alkB family protein 6
MAIDFQNLLREERAKARAAAGGAAPLSGLAPAEAPARLATTATEPPPCSFRLCASSSRARLGSSSVVDGAPPTVWHVRDWVSIAEEVAMLQAVADSPLDAWTPLRGRRLQNFGGVPRPAPEGMVPEPMPGWVDSVLEELVAAGIFSPDAPPNHVLLNEYEPGQGIAPHRDGPLYAPTVAILSLGSACAFDFVSNDTERDILASLLLPPRGLLVFAGDAYHQHLHTVPAVALDGNRPGRIRLDLAGEGQPPPREGLDEAGADALPPPPPRGRRISLTVRRPPPLPQPEP